MDPIKMASELARRDALPRASLSRFFPLVLFPTAVLACRGGSCVSAVREIAPDVSWVSGGNSIAEGYVNRDAVLDFVGVFTNRGTEGPLYVGAFDGASFGLLWRSASIGSDWNNAYLVKLGIAGGRVAVADTQGLLHVLDLASGNEVGSAQLAERADEICAPADDPRRLWVSTKDRKTAFFDPTTLALVPAPRPASCPVAVMKFTGSCSATPPDVRARRAECASREAPPPVSDFVALDGSVDGPDGVASGIKTHGSAVPILVGFTPGRAGVEPALRWQRGVVQGSSLGAKEGDLSELPLANGRAFVGYEDLRSRHHLEAIEAATGRTLWDEPTESFFHVRATATRVYVMRWTRLDVRDATTGALLGGVGSR
jgi:hypothetical protein